MARSKFKTVDMSEEAVQEREIKQLEKQAKKSKEVEVTIPSEETLAPEMTEAIISEETEEETSETKKDDSSKQQVGKVLKSRGKKYMEARAQIDKTRTYSISDGVELLKKIKFTKFDESVEIHLLLRDIIPAVEVQYPHSTGKVLRVTILNDDVIGELEKGVINFDVLLATPAGMGKITKFARLLGPKGLMPNPKNGTLVGDPNKRKAELEAGKVAIRGEKKAPLMHTTVGKASLATKDLAENIEALIKSLGMGKVLKATICTSMSPGIRITVNQ